MSSSLSASASPTPSPLAAWVTASRPATLTVAAAPVVVGSACAFASGRFVLGPALAALAGSFCIQIGTNLANDVFDFEKGADTAERLGPTRAVQAGLLSAAQVRRGMYLCFALATLCGLYLTAVGGWPVMAIGIASILSGIAYTGGPWPLGYHGLGDVFVLLFFGFVAVCGTAFVQVGSVPPLAWIASIPVGALATAVLVVNNLRDRTTDVHAGKRTLAVRFGRTFAVGEYVALLASAELSPLLAVRALGTWWPLLPLVTLPLAVGLARKVAASEGRALNPLLGATARLLLVHSLLFAAGLVAARMP